METPTFAIISERNRRTHMEDRHFLELNFSGQHEIFGGVYDGHCGERAAIHSAEYLHGYFADFLEKELPEKAFIRAYQKTSDEISDDSGACAANFYIKNRKIFFANAGDARIIIVGKKTHQLTVDHRVDSTIEKIRIEKMGGVIAYPYAYRDDRGLMPTRTIGDHYFKKIGIIATPHVGQYSIKPKDKFLIAGTDGLFDGLTNGEIEIIAREAKEPEKIADILRRNILSERKTSDNITVIILALTATKTK